MKKLIVLILVFAVKSGIAQPGPQDPWGAFDMSFVLFDSSTSEVIDSKNKEFKIFNTAFSKDGTVIYDSFKFNSKTKSFYYSFESTPIGPSIPIDFSINIVSGLDTMKIYFAAIFTGDTLHFQKGEFIASKHYVAARHIETYDQTKILNQTIYDYEISKLTDLPYYNLVENGYTKLDHISHPISGTLLLPNGKRIAHGYVHERKYKGNVLNQYAGEGISGSYTPYLDITSIDDVGIGFSFLDSNKISVINYEYEILESLLKEIDVDFSLSDEGFSSHFPMDWIGTILVQ